MGTRTWDMLILATSLVVSKGCKSATKKKYGSGKQHTGSWMFWVVDGDLYCLS